MFWVWLQLLGTLVNTGNDLTIRVADWGLGVVTVSWVCGDLQLRGTLVNTGNDLTVTGVWGC